MPDAPALRVLVVEDDPDTRENLCDILEIDDHDVAAAATAAEALNRDNWDDYAAILLDWRLPDASAATLLPQLRELAPEAAVIVTTGIGGLEEAVVAIRHGAVDYISKPIDADLLRASLNRVAVQRQLRLEKVRPDAAFRTLVEAAGSLIIILRPDGRIAYANPFAEHLLGYSQVELLDHNCVELMTEPEFRPAASEHLKGVLGDQLERGFELPVLSRGRVRHWVLWNLQLTDFAGEAAILAIGQDITDRKRAEEKLLEAERLAAIGKAMTGLAHESRNALQRGQSTLELLALIVEDNAEAVDLVKRLQGVQADLHRLYEEVREYAAPMNLERTECELGPLIHEAWESLDHLHGRREADLKIISKADDAVCLVDRYRMLQVLKNILENSLAATPDRVHIVATISSTILEGMPGVAIRIRDNGPGIPKAKVESVFDEFFTTKTRGTGLGLAIVRRIVNAHGGRVWVDPSDTAGAEFVIELQGAKS